MTFIHKSLKSKTLWCAFKLDIHKAYDKLSWNFLEAVLICMDFPRRIINIIMQCVRTLSYSLLLNGHMVDSFLPQRGLRQGDPMSILVLFMCKCFSYLLLRAKKRKELVGVRFARRVLIVSRLMYVDDTILFFKADDSNCLAVNNALSIYTNLAGQQLNNDKSFLVFSPNTSRKSKDRIVTEFGANVSTRIGKYLGMFIDSKVNDPQNYMALVKRINNRLSGWKLKTLSQTGRLTLIKAIKLGGAYNHLLQQVHLRGRSCRYRTQSRQELQLKNCLFLLKRKKKRMTSIIAGFSVRGRLSKVSIWNKGRFATFNTFLLDVIRSFLLASTRNQDSL
ncbi:ribonuclease H [Senna tora]|uniref:Ribonuclease H n=1 Tax=Senna tora TaxID=362788 RepID=A0A834X7R3_9FABA|nr:ribonuclease H [Senna tora]